MEGNVIVNGLNTNHSQVYELTEHVGMVFQNPDSQIFSLRVEDEVAFGPENLGFSHEVIVERVQNALSWVDIAPLRSKLTFAISGGQKQKVAIASNLAMLPKIFVLDEPTTDLDPISAREVVATVDRLRNTLNFTFIIVEHDLDELIAVADRLVVLNHGEVALDGSPRELMGKHYDELSKIGIRLPEHIELGHLISNSGEGTVTVDETQTLLQNFIRMNALKSPNGPQVKTDGNDVVLSVEDLSYGYSRKELILSNISFNIHRKEFVAIVGHNGSGKTTLAKNLIGLLKPTNGDVVIRGINTKDANLFSISKHVGYLFQNPDAQLFTNSIWDEVAFGLKIRKYEEKEIRTRVDKVLNIVGLSQYKTRHPFSLSRGERKRLALASVLVIDPDVIILDEPTTGQDQKTLSGFLGLMQKLIDEKNATIIMVTHDMRIVAEYAKRMLVMSHGEIILDGDTRDIFRDHEEQLTELNLLPPSIPEMCNRLRSDGCPFFLTLSEIRQATGR
jgi:energy-coupling factor transport system ATP-binding protein